MRYWQGQLVVNICAVAHIVSSLYLSYEWFVGLEWEITDGWLETGMEQNRVTVGDGFKVGIFKNMEQEQRKEIDEWKIMVGEWLQSINI